MDIVLDLDGDMDDAIAAMDAKVRNGVIEALELLSEGAEVRLWTFIFPRVMSPVPTRALIDWLLDRKMVVLVSGQTRRNLFTVTVARELKNDNNAKAAHDHGLHAGVRYADHRHRW